MALQDTLSFLLKAGMIYWIIGAKEVGLWCEVLSVCLGVGLCFALVLVV